MATYIEHKEKILYRSCDLYKAISNAKSANLRYDVSIDTYNMIGSDYYDYVAHVKGPRLVSGIRGPSNSVVRRHSTAVTRAACQLAEALQEAARDRFSFDVDTDSGTVVVRVARSNIYGL